ncbi:hypothetical protein POUND7_010665 [Theobroma cacao]
MVAACRWCSTDEVIIESDLENAVKWAKDPPAAAWRIRGILMQMELYKTKLKACNFSAGSSLLLRSDWLSFALSLLALATISLQIKLENDNIWNYSSRVATIIKLHFPCKGTDPIRPWQVTTYGTIPAESPPSSNFIFRAREQIRSGLGRSTADLFSVDDEEVNRSPVLMRRAEEAVPLPLKNAASSSYSVS